MAKNDRDNLVEFLNAYEELCERYELVITQCNGDELGAQPWDCVDEDHFDWLWSATFSMQG